MKIGSIDSIVLFNSNETKTKQSTNYGVDNQTDQIETENLAKALNDAAEELTVLGQLFARSGKNSSRKNESNNIDDPAAFILEDEADAKIDLLVKKVANLRDKNTLLNLTRNLFPDDSDMLLALQEMLRNRRLSEALKKVVKEAIDDLYKTCDQKKMRAGINVGRVAQRFSGGEGNIKLSARDLRNNYLLFIGCETSASYVYQNWIKQYGCRNRKRLLAFILSALVADIKSHEPGIHFDEFGPLSDKLSDARILHTLDESLNKTFDGFDFRSQMLSAHHSLLDEGSLVNLYLAGLINFGDFKNNLKIFSKNFMASLYVSQRAIVIQELFNTFKETPEFLYTDKKLCEIIMNFMSTILLSLHKRERDRLSVPNIINNI